MERVRALGAVDLGRAHRGLEDATLRRRLGQGGANVTLEPDLAGRDLSQRDDGRLVALGLDQRRGAGGQLTGAAGGEDAEGEAAPAPEGKAAPKAEEKPKGKKEE